MPPPLNTTFSDAVRAISVICPQHVSLTANQYLMEIIGSNDAIFSFGGFKIIGKLLGMISGTKIDSIIGTRIRANNRKALSIQLLAPKSEK